MNKKYNVFIRTFLISVFVVLTSSATLAQNVWAWEDVKLEEAGSGYKFVWHRPYFTKIPGQSDVRFQWHHQVEETMETDRKDFTKHFRESQAEQEGRDFKSAEWSHEVKYDVVWQDKLNLIVNWHGYQYSGGAHGNHLQRLSIFRQDTAEVYSSSAFLFDYNPAALEILSRESRAGLIEYLGEESSQNEWLLKGSAPQWKNFKMCYPTKNENGERVFRVTFDSYQVGPYAIGTPSVDIAWDKLAPYAVNLIF